MLIRLPLQSEMTQAVGSRTGVTSHDPTVADGPAIGFAQAAVEAAWREDHERMRNFRVPGNPINTLNPQAIQNAFGHGYPEALNSTSPRQA